MPRMNNTGAVSSVAPSAQSGGVTGAMPRPQSTGAPLSYQDYSSKYLNQKNPTTNMYWQTEDVAKDAGVGQDLISAYLTQAQQANLGKQYEMQGVGPESGWTPSTFRYDQQPWYKGATEAGWQAPGSTPGRQAAPFADQVYGGGLQAQAQGQPQGMNANSPLWQQMQNRLQRRKTDLSNPWGRTI